MKLRKCKCGYAMYAKSKDKDLSNALFACEKCDGPAADPTKTNPNWNQVWPRTYDDPWNVEWRAKNEQH